ncbi:DUF3139 domain-containing protein [Bacillus atrophaeus]|uniref:DUF3139 domain-containing protein n=1 Tax=Bacillus atrophaeus TaxID=1452 RepID=UPI00077A403D|nr:DUF3139 domain-containing protein [Bacillus atrophaeus]KXZ12911.1 hypothetical protein AXI57_17035 [Bacillus atrophaeus]MED4809516.1 DUF3139 domain-containing protein [Bacillus atrophaeus]GED03049.1 hypothetical protein BAT02nite_26930 [Bacillus atrophaeus]
MVKKIVLSLIALVIIVVGASLLVHFNSRKVAEDKIDQYISDYGIPKKDIKSEEYPMFNSLSAPKGFTKTVYVKNENNKDNYYIFHYDPSSKKVNFSGVVEGSEVSIHDKLIKKLKYQPSDKVLNQD